MHSALDRARVRCKKDHAVIYVPLTEFFAFNKTFIIAWFSLKDDK